MAQTGTAEGRTAAQKGWYDLHCHLLPGMDDGCKTCEESLEVLRRSAQQGVCGIAATPHYYPVETVDRFLERREQALRRLERALEGREPPVPALCLGAEVAYHPGLVWEEKLEKLCLGRSRYLLLELPFVRWPPGVVRDVRTLCRVRQLTPIIAHLERYWKLEERHGIQELLEMEVLVQINAEAFAGVWRGRAAQRLLRQGKVQVLSSDCHNLTARPPNLGTTVRQLEKKGLGPLLEPVRSAGQQIFESAAF